MIHEHLKFESLIWLFYSQMSRLQALGLVCVWAIHSYAVCSVMLSHTIVSDTLLFCFGTVEEEECAWFISSQYFIVMSRRRLDSLPQWLYLPPIKLWKKKKNLFYNVTQIPSKQYAYPHNISVFCVLPASDNPVSWWSLQQISLI